MRLEWRHDLETGDPLIDGAHQDIFGKIGELIAACQEHRERHEVARMLSYLHNYVRSHFAAEERYQASHGYPHSRSHAEQHLRLVQSLRDLESEHLREGASLPVVTNSLKLTYQWLSEHILKWDKEMASYGRGAA